MGLEGSSLGSDFLDNALDVSLLIDQLLVRDDEHVQLLLLVVKGLLSLYNLSLQLLLLLLRPLSLGTRHLSLQLLDLVLGVVQKLLLSLLLLLELVDGGLQVSGSRQGT